MSVRYRVVMIVIYIDCRNGFDNIIILYCCRKQVVDDFDRCEFSLLLRAANFEIEDIIQSALSELSLRQNILKKFSVDYVWFSTRTLEWGGGASVSFGFWRMIIIAMRAYRGLIPSGSNALTVCVGCIKRRFDPGTLPMKKNLSSCRFTVEDPLTYSHTTAWIQI